MIPVFCYGGYRNRNPLSYDAIRSRLGDRVALVDTPADARLLVISHHADFDLFGRQIFEMLAAVPDLRLVLLSEEPFWDSIWMPDPVSRHQSHETEHGVLPYTVLNHVTSGIYKADRIPYFLLTDPRYIAHYRPMTARNAGMSATAWHDHFSNARDDAVFMNIRRTGQVFFTELSRRRYVGVIRISQRLRRAMHWPNRCSQGSGVGGRPPAAGA